MNGTEQIVHHYSAESAPRGFWAHALPMQRYARTVWRSRQLVRDFTWRELIGRFHGSAGGFLWVIVQPVFQFCVYFFIFGVLFGRGELLGQTNAFFAFYLFSGIVLFGVVLEGTQRGLVSVVGNANLVRKVVFPCELLPLPPVLAGVAVYLVGCSVLVLTGLPAGQVHLGWPLLGLPVVIAALIGLTNGIAMLLAAANVFARDVAQLYGVLSMAWFFLTPIFWDVTLIEQKAREFGVPGVVSLLPLNPAYCLVLAQRQVFGIGLALPEAEYAASFPLSLGTNLLGAVAWALVMQFVGYGFFMSRKHKIVDLV